MKNTVRQDEIIGKLPEIQELIQDMAAELRFRGCDDNHKLIKQAYIVNGWLQKAGDNK